MELKSVAKTKEQIAEYKRQWCLKNKDRLAAKKAQYAKINKEHIAAYQAQYKKRNKARLVAYRLKNKEHIRLYNADYAMKHSEQIATRSKRYKKENRGLYTARENKRRAAKLQRRPKWLTEEHLNQIKEIYVKCPKGLTVDHIIPLQGRNVSGLDVPWNMQYLSKSENSRKNNKHESEGNGV